MKKLLKASSTALILAIAITGCSDDDDDDGGAPPPSVSGCEIDPELEPGRHDRSLFWGGEERMYEIFVPELPIKDDNGFTPLVFNLHPFVLGGNDLFHVIWRRESRLEETAEQEGFILVHPNGTGTPTAWNGGEECCGQAASNGVDDVGFLQALAEEVASEVCVDERRIYATGMSNGGYLSHRLACEEPDFVAAIAPVVGSFSKELICKTELRVDIRSVPVLQISGSEDNLPGRTQSVERWLDLNECEEEGEITHDEGTLTCTTWQCSGGAEVEHCIVDGGGHCWFSDLEFQLTPNCPATDDLNSHEKVWEFMSRWSLPE